MIKAIIFDVGGVILTESYDLLEKDISKIYNIPIRLVRQKFEPILDYELEKGLITPKELWLKFSRTVDKKLPSNWKQLLSMSYNKNFIKIKGVTELVKKLRENGYKTAILSNTNIRHAAFCRKNRIYYGFDLIILSHLVGMRKPDKEIYLLILKRLGLKPKECVFVDDREPNIKTANELGINGILFKGTLDLKRKLKKLKVDI